MRRILINEKNEFSFLGLKISSSNQGAKTLGFLFGADNNRNSKNTAVIVSNKTDSGFIAKRRS